MATKAVKKRAKYVPAKRVGFDITIEGFKSISRKETLTFRPLTVLSGSNSSGKSSFMQPLLMLKQTLEAPYDPGALLINGPHVKFTSTQQFLAEGSGSQRAQKLSVGYSRGSTDLLLNFTRSSDKKPIELSQQVITTGKTPFSMKVGEKYDSPFVSVPPNVQEYLKMFFPPNYKKINAQVAVFRDRCFLNLGLEHGSSDITPLPLTQRLLGNFPHLLRTMIHLPGLRGNPERTYPLSAVGKTFPGPFQSYAASIIDSWQEQSSPPLETLNQYLQELNLASRIVTRKIDETQVELKVNRISSDSGSYVSIADVGMAVSQILPVLVALAAAESGQLVFIEQPELHLHPRAQLNLARILCAAVERGITLVLETHSSLLLLGIQTCIAEGLVDSTNVALHWFTRDQEGVTCIESAKLDKTGSFGDWPEDFGDVSLEAENEYLSAAERSYTGDKK